MSPIAKLVWFPSSEVVIGFEPWLCWVEWMSYSHKGTNCWRKRPIDCTVLWESSWTKLRIQPRDCDLDRYTIISIPIKTGLSELPLTSDSEVRNFIFALGAMTQLVRLQISYFGSPLGQNSLIKKVWIYHNKLKSWGQEHYSRYVNSWF